MSMTKSARKFHTISAASSQSRADDPLSARYQLDQSYEMGREGWRIRIETRLAMRASATHFFLEATLEAYENDALVRTRAVR